MLISATLSSPAEMPVRSIPGSYGLPLLGPLKDRLDYFWFQGQDDFFRRRMAATKSTVFRTNIPPTFPFFLGIDPRVVAVVDCAAFPALFDNSLVDKRDVLVGAYSPSVSFTRGTRVGVYRDTTEPEHAKTKSFSLDLLRRSSAVWASEFLRKADELFFSAVESDVSSNGSSSFLAPLQKCLFSFLCKSIAGADTSSSEEMASGGHNMINVWLALQLIPTVKTGVLPQPLEELLLHSFPFPAFLVQGGYNKIYNFIKKEGQAAIQLAKEYNINEDDAINNILFVIGFNAFGGFSIFLPALITAIGTDKSGLQEELRREVRQVLAGGDKLPGFETVNKMELVKSTVYEVLRMKPPVALQFGRAREDFTLRSHDAAFMVAKGELLCGYQPLAMRDPKVFDNPENFNPKRFLENKKLLEYLYWSNGPETESPTVGNKQCAAKDYVVMTACLLVAEIFRRYDRFECDEKSSSITKVEKATSMAAASTTSVGQ